MSARDPAEKAERLAARGKIDRALDLYVDVVETSPQDVTAWRRIVDLHAVKAERHLGDNRPTDAANSLVELARVSAQQRWYRRSIRAYKRARELDPGRADIGAALLAVRRARWLGLARFCALAAGWQLCLYLAGPPRELWPLASVAVIFLYLAIRQTTPGRAAAIGWFFGWMVNLEGYRWGVGVLEEFAHMSAVSSLVAVSLMCAYQGVVWMLWALLCNVMGRGRSRGQRFDRSVRWLVVAPLALALFESIVPMVFPWYFAIYATSAWPLLQVAEIGGPPAVSALLVAMGLVVYEAGVSIRHGRVPRRAVLIAGALLAAIVFLGCLRAWHVAASRSDAATLRVGIVQPNIGIMSVDTREREGQRIIDVLRRGTAEARARGAELIVWGESMFPYLFDRGLRREYAPGHPWELSPGYRGRLLFGALAHPFGQAHIYNSAVLVSGSGEIAGIYDKTMLLALGEYIPFSDYFPDWAARMRKKLPDWPAIMPGTGPGVLTDGDLRIAPLICYEDILPSHVHDSARRDVNLLVTLANHAWFGDSAAPHQARALAVLRGVETRRDLVRATITGVSSFSDALGRIIGQGRLVEADPENPASHDVLVEDVALLDMVALAPYTAPLFPYGCALIVIAMVFVDWRRKQRR
ncbi:MAG: apolipoprotein N-acyltransferase [Proteobacteria bacterium]|nr:apolipoprotein N-acyltransferase [Pseudomonadota bacterium]